MFTFYCILIYVALLGSCFIVAVPTASLIERRLRKRERERHRKQAEQDMYEMQKVYTNLLINQIMKGN